MPNKIIVEVEALDYKVTERDIAEALKSHFPNMPTRVREIRPTQRAVDGAMRCPICGFGYPAFGERSCPVHGTPRN